MNGVALHIMTPLDLFPMAFLTFSRITFPALSAVFEAANDKLDSYGRVLLRRWSQRASISQWFKSRESCVTKAMIDIRCARCLHIMRRLVRHRVKSKVIEITTILRQYNSHRYQLQIMQVCNVVSNCPSIPLNMAATWCHCSSPPDHPRLQSPKPS